MAEPIVEEEVALARRAFPKAQELLAGVPEGQPRYIDVGWYDSEAHPETGAFALAREGGPHTDLVGQILRVENEGRVVFVYVVGGGDVPHDLSLYRRAFFGLGLLTHESLGCHVEAVT